MGLRYDGVMVHPNYDKVNVRNDVAILLLDGTSDQAYVVINRDDNVPYEGEYLTVMGAFPFLPPLKRHLYLYLSHGDEGRIYTTNSRINTLVHFI